MASQAWLESSLRRSASLGLEVLERASRRSVDWTNAGPTHTPAATDTDTHQRAHAELEDVFATIAGFMSQTTSQCTGFYGSDCCSEPTDTERRHVSRFHTQLAAGTTTPPLSTIKHGNLPAAEEDFLIDVSPGTYAITASTEDTQQQTQLVTVRAGESVNLTFNL